jgi:hypothetical protein
MTTLAEVLWVFMSPLLFFYAIYWFIVVSYILWRFRTKGEIHWVLRLEDINDSKHEIRFSDLFGFLLTSFLVVWIMIVPVAWKFAEWVANQIPNPVILRRGAK